MVKILLIITSLSTLIFASNAFDEKCVKCHSKLTISMQDIMKLYLLTYSGEKNIKMGIDHYMKYPSRDISLMPIGFLNEYGIIRHKKIPEGKLKEAIDIFWMRYKIIGRLK